MEFRQPLRGFDLDLDSDFEMSHYSTHYRSHQVQVKERTRREWTIAMHT